MSTKIPAQHPNKSGRKRATLTAAALLGVGALVTAAAFTDFALLDLNGSGGIGGSANKYNIQVSTQSVDRASDVSEKQWVEANPEAESLDIPGADALIPGGKSIVAKIPVRNASHTMRSSLDLSLQNTTAPTDDAAEDAKNRAYGQLLHVDVALLDDASDLSKVSWKPVEMNSFATGEKSERVRLDELDADSGKIAVLRIGLNSSADDNAANGGTVAVQARFDGTAIN
ncbi:hypothetical protein GCM10027417_22360 [Glutamicibacter endophyticus]